MLHWQILWVRNSDRAQREHIWMCASCSRYSTRRTKSSNSWVAADALAGPGRPGLAQAADRNQDHRSDDPPVAPPPRGCLGVGTFSQGGSTLWRWLLLGPRTCHCDRINGGKDSTAPSGISKLSNCPLNTLNSVAIICSLYQLAWFSSWFEVSPYVEAAFNGLWFSSETHLL